jgi:hypothetical protein
MADLRCPYCVEEDEFKRMVRHFDGRFICSKCGHMVHPAAPFRCTCWKCLQLSRFERNTVESSRPWWAAP